jgi:hypothetical protein
MAWIMITRKERYTLEKIYGYSLLSSEGYPQHWAFSGNFPKGYLMSDKAKWERGHAFDPGAITEPVTRRELHLGRR